MILGMVAAWNDLGVVPDVLTADLRIDPDRIADRYPVEIEANFIEIDRGPKLPTELAIIEFNRRLQRLDGQYDLLINTGNSLWGLPKDQQVLTYLFFPRKVRVESSAVSIHQPDVPLGAFTRHGVERRVARQIYRRARLRPEHDIVCMTQFTREALRSAYGVEDELPIIYPPVDFDSYTSSADKQAQVATMGRFVPDKRQVEQIRAARDLPELPFHIMGFAGNGSYLATCRTELGQAAAPNVTLWPDMAFDRVQATLGQSRYFLHTLVDEPFGLTAVEAIAAGCLPVVHDSGGQRETVPVEELRYRSFAEIPETFRALEGRTDAERSEIVNRLQHHARTEFSAAAFDTGIKSVFERYL